VYCVGITGVEKELVPAVAGLRGFLALGLAGARAAAGGGALGGATGVVDGSVVAEAVVVETAAD